jgi:hypothetical protein
MEAGRGLAIFALLMMAIAVFSASALVLFYSSESADRAPALSSGGFGALSLKLSLNSTQISQGQSLAATVSLYNTLETNLTLRVYSNSSAYGVISEWDNYDFLCGSGGPYNLVGFALLAGHYTPNNISDAPAPLHLAPPVGFPCTINVEPYSVVFLPRSDTAVLRWTWNSASQGYKTVVAVNASTETCYYAESNQNSTFFTFACGIGKQGLYGYWVWNTTYPFMPNSTLSWNQFQADHFQKFAPGPYTLVAVDLWGQYAYAYFEVTQS